ncbi:efflux RND transporter periplasmic adaptor subunit [Planococcus sp. ISL-110]|uniref:efflux RND transporter periplasmic adaptor subunit n=1 Tax=Planococcus sp. ISL-110 TaxID=2819167 RepID=UPI001BEC8853|nr:efflux RND transporter periplasmic adaptor subunit [Planococcus sp. ISL-110]MBT2570934.1 efflux RND transporter periplasmic adaptor subunit [Planococcus sp. ISL-110]
MNRFFFIGLSVAVIAFLTANSLLMFGDKSILSKSVYVSDYQEAYTQTYETNLFKEALTAPQGTVEIYVQDHEALQQWMVKEGDNVTAGSELATLNEAETEEQRSVWETQKTALEAQRTEVSSSLATLQQARAAQGGPVSQDAADNSEITNEDDETIQFDVNVSVGVAVPQDGSYAAGIAQAEQQLASIESQLAVLDAQLSQNLSNPAVISPVDGTVSQINRDTEPLSIEIYSNEKVFLSYVLEDEWPLVEVADLVKIEGEGIEGIATGTVQSVSEMPAEESKWLAAYHQLDPTEQNNPLAFYEVRIVADTPIDVAMPYGSNVNTSITLETAEDAVALPTDWLFDYDGVDGKTHTLNINGRPKALAIAADFEEGTKTVLSAGPEAGAVVINEDKLENFVAPPKVFMPFPIRQPDFEYAKNTYWRAYVEYLLAR